MDVSPHQLIPLPSGEFLKGPAGTMERYRDAQWPRTFVVKRDAEIFVREIMAHGGFPTFRSS